jgi:DNA-binding SARP family transcriptional activator
VFGLNHVATPLSVNNETKSPRARGVETARRASHGQRSLADAQTMANEARAEGDTLLEAVACAVAMICIQDARETYAGLADWQQQALACSRERWPASAATTVSNLDNELLTWAWLGQLAASLFSGSQPTLIENNAEALMRWASTDESISASTVLICTRYLLGVAEVSASQSWLGRIDALAASALARSSDDDRFARDEWLAERAVVAGFMLIHKRIDVATLSSQLDRAANVGPRQRFKLERAKLQQVIHAGDLNIEEESLAAFRAALPPNERVPWIAYLRSFADHLTRAGKPAQAESVLREALTLAERISAHPPLLTICWSQIAIVQGAQGRLADAAASYDRASQYALPAHRTLMLAPRDALLGLSAIDDDRATARERFSAALSALRGVSAYGFLNHAPHAAARVCAYALEMEIEPKFVHEVIARRHLKVPYAHADAWPWKIRIRLFGGFRCDFSLESESDAKTRNKPPKRIIGLLKWLAHAGADGIDRRTLLRRLWPNEASEEQSGAFDMALMRLRKLLPTDDLIISDKGVLRINGEFVWVDAWSFVSLCDHIDARFAQSPLPNANVLIQWAKEINQLVAARYLEGEDDAAVIEVVAEQLRERFVKVQERLAEAIAVHDATLARDVLAKSLEREPYAEQLYRALMRLHLRTGDFADAVRTYRRAQTAISRAYGVMLSSQTQALLDQLPRHERSIER